MKIKDSDYTEYEDEIMSLYIVRHGMISWMGRHVVRKFLSDLLIDGIILSSVISAASTCDKGGLLVVRGDCKKDGDVYEYKAVFRSQGPMSESLLDIGEEVTFVDTLRNHVELESMELKPC